MMKEQHEKMFKKEEKRMVLELLVCRIEDEHTKGEVNFNYLHSETLNNSFYIMPVHEKEPVASLGFKICVVHITPEHISENYFEDIAFAVEFIQKEYMKRERIKRR